MAWDNQLQEASGRREGGQKATQAAGSSWCCGNEKSRNCRKIRACQVHSGFNQRKLQPGFERLADPTGSSQPIKDETEKMNRTWKSPLY